MKSTGLVRKTDALGRIAVPKDLRDRFKIMKDTPMEICVDGRQIILQKYKRTCTFCKNTQDVVVYQNKNICKNCIEELNELNK